MKRNGVQCTSVVIINLLTLFSGQVHTLTVDKKKEFVDHKVNAAKLNAKIYFADLNGCLELGLSGKANSLIHEHFSKK